MRPTVRTIEVMVYGTVALVLLAALPPVLMAWAHAYALATQDRKVRCLVVLDPAVRSVKAIAEAHARRYGVTVDRTWDSSVKGYSGWVSVKRIQMLQRDRRVQSVEQAEVDEFLEPVAYH
jgi:hypothetical protein